MTERPVFVVCLRPKPGVAPYRALKAGGFFCNL